MKSFINSFIDFPLKIFVKPHYEFFVNSLKISHEQLPIVIALSITFHKGLTTLSILSPTGIVLTLTLLLLRHLKIYMK